MICTGCGKDKPEEDFWWIRQHEGLRRSRCAECSRSRDAKVDAKMHAKQHSFTPVEQYVIEKLAAKPSLASALDDLYKRRPERWHQVVVAAMLHRREQAK